MMVGAVLPCSDHIRRSQVSTQPAEECRPGDDTAGGSYEDKNLDWVGTPHLWVAGSGLWPRVTQALLGMKSNEVFLSNQMQGGEKV